tara:strand:- start:5741 stop:6589 length:849 start_codon:yes stop_codon:yes gene_type:complete
MSKKIIFIADWFVDQINGGGELNNDEFVKVVKNIGYDITCLSSHNLTREILDQTKNCHYIFGNFLNVNPVILETLVNGKIKYSIYEHDHKYLKNRDPSIYKDFLAPKNDLVNLEFYSNAVAIFCQSKLHTDTVQRNLNLNSVHNLSGNIWSLNSLSILSEISSIKKNQKVSIWNSSNPIKNTSKAVAYCRLKNIDYELIGGLPYDQFLSKIGKNNTFMFFPETMETLCRVVVEARMMNMKTITNGLLGATSENWFSLKGKELIQVMKEKRESIPKYILETIK